MIKSDQPLYQKINNYRFREATADFPVLKIVAPVDGTEASYNKFRELLTDINNLGVEINIATKADPQTQHMDPVEARKKSVGLLSNMLDHCRAFNMPCTSSIVESNGSVDVFHDHAMKTNSHLIFDTTNPKEAEYDSMVMKTVRDDPVGFGTNDNVFAYLSSLIGRSFVQNVTFK